MPIDRNPGTIFSGEIGRRYAPTSYLFHLELFHIPIRNGFLVHLFESGVLIPASTLASRLQHRSGSQESK